MRSFLQYLIKEEEEKVSGKPLKHLTHVEDYVIHHGHEGVGIADAHLRGVHNKLLGKGGHSLHVSTKWDGAPSVVFGRDPKTGLFFVATKSAFNATPKINFTDADIEKNHGHAPGLVEKLKAALKYLPHIIPKTGGIYQGDIMHTQGDAKTKNGQISVTPNTITYSAPKDSQEGQGLAKKFGIVVHTKYSGKGSLENMHAEPLDNKTRLQFASHNDVNNIDPTQHVNPQNYTPDEQKQFIDHMENARLAYAKVKPEAGDIVKKYGTDLESHINDMIRKEEEPSVEGFVNHITARRNREADKLKTPEAKNKRIASYSDMLGHIVKNKSHIKSMMEVHKHLQNAKNVLAGVMAKNNPYAHSIGGVPTSEEGNVVADKQGNSSKIVNRQEFSRQNFLKGAFQKAKANEDAKV